MTAPTAETAEISPVRAPWTTRNRVGLGLLVLYALTNLPSAFVDPGTGDQAGPPTSILVLDTVLAAVALVATIVGWRLRSRTVVRISCAATVLLTVTALPAFFVGVPAAIKLIVAVSVIWTVVAVVLALTPSRRP